MKLNKATKKVLERVSKGEPTLGGDVSYADASKAVGTLTERGLIIWAAAKWTITESGKLLLQREALQ